MNGTVYGDRPETLLRSAPRLSAGVRNHVLLGTWLEVVQRQGDWIEVATAGRGPGGWVHRDDVRDTPCLKVFFVDVGQGDGAIVEGPNGRILIDGGPSRGFHDFVRYLYGPTLARGEAVHFDAVVMSHPDMDHYRGLTRVLQDAVFTFGTVFHNGIIRYRDDSPSGEDFDLGRLSRPAGSPPILTETFSTLDQARRLVADGDLMTTFRQFWEAALGAEAGGRLERARRITSRDEALPGFGRRDADDLFVEVLAPVPTASSGAFRYVTFPDPHDHPSTSPSSSHTRNGHSIVLRLTFGAHTLLFGGDLNIPAQRHLLDAYGGENPFRVDVAKACHHGSSDFSVDFLRQVRPMVNVFSSGDNKSFDHPMADAMGAAGRHTRGDRPLLFSTELARAQIGRGIHYGLINARSNGRTLVMAQMKEQHDRADVWDSYTVPWPGRFPEVDR